MQLHKKIMITGSVALTLGLAAALPMVYFWHQNQQAVAQAAKIVVPSVAPVPAATPTVITGKPVRLQIPSLTIDLTVADGVYNTANGSWSLSRDKAHYALPTIQPNNEAGNTLIYGHYRPEVFARLHKIADGAEAILTTDNGHVFTYTLANRQTVDPSDTSIFAYEGAPQLTIQTCTGIWMQNRQLFTFSFTAVE